MFLLRTILIVVVLVFWTSSSFALTVFLKRDLGTQGFLRYCLYSNDEQYTVNSIDLCPLSVDVGMDFGGGAIGFLAGEYRDGMSKVCVYDVLGEQKATRISGIGICPLSERF